MGVRPTRNNGKREVKRASSRPLSIDSSSSNGGRKHSTNSSDVKKASNEKMGANSNKSTSITEAKRASDGPLSIHSNSDNSNKNTSADTKQDVIMDKNAESVNGDSDIEFISRANESLHSIHSGSDAGKVKKSESVNKRNGTNKTNKKLKRRWMRRLSRKSTTKKCQEMNASMNSPSEASVAPFTTPKKDPVKLKTIEENHSPESQSRKTPSKETETSTVCSSMHEHAMNLRTKRLCVNPSCHQ